MRAVITGATGLIGRALTLRLLQEGHEVTVVTRDVARAASILGEEVQAVTWTDVIALRAALEGCDAVVNLAGESVVKRRWSAAQKEVLWASRVDLTGKLVRTIGQCSVPPAVLINASAVGIYGHASGVVDESSCLLYTSPSPRD